MPTTHTVETQLLLCKKFLTLIKSGHTWAIFRNMIILIAVNTGLLSMFALFSMEEFRLSIIPFESPSSTGLMSFHFFNAWTSHDKSHSCHSSSPLTRSAFMPVNFSITFLAIPLTLSSLPRVSSD